MPTMTSFGTELYETIGARLAAGADGDAVAMDILKAWCDEAITDGDVCALARFL